jgi:NAD(P)-dependent dehydrogenase (short-subunit alcohol dehydrogenase family)
VARALIVGCGCRGRELGRELASAGWAVRGTTRRPAGAEAIEASGIDAVVADPDRVLTVLEQIEGVTLVLWLLGSARGDAGLLEALHGPRLERMLEEIVDTPVRGFVYEAAGSVEPRLRERGRAIVTGAARRWRIPSEFVDADPDDATAWRDAMLAAVGRLVGGTYWESGPGLP